jgi:tRNA A22 N-methylase
MLSRFKDRWLLSIFNNEGVDRSVEKGDYLIAEADRKVEINFKHTPDKLNVMYSLNMKGNIEKNDESSYVTIVGAGGFVILEFT